MRARLASRNGYRTLRPHPYEPVKLRLTWAVAIGRRRRRLCGRIGAAVHLTRAGQQAPRSCRSRDRAGANSSARSLLDSTISIPDRERDHGGAAPPAQAAVGNDRAGAQRALSVPHKCGREGPRSRLGRRGTAPAGTVRSSRRRSTPGVRTAYQPWAQPRYRSPSKAAAQPAQPLYA